MVANTFTCVIFASLLLLGQGKNVQHDNAKGEKEVEYKQDLSSEARTLSDADNPEVTTGENSVRPLSNTPIPSDLNNSPPPLLRNSSFENGTVNNTNSEHNTTTRATRQPDMTHNPVTSIPLVEESIHLNQHTPAASSAEPVHNGGKQRSPAGSTIVTSPAAPATTASAAELDGSNSDALYTESHSAQESEPVHRLSNGSDPDISRTAEDIGGNTISQNTIPRRVESENVTSTPVSLPSGAGTDTNSNISSPSHEKVKINHVTASRVSSPVISNADADDVEFSNHILSLIDGVYQQSMDDDASTTFITPMDLRTVAGGPRRRSTPAPFALLVDQYERYVDEEARRLGKSAEDDGDLEDALERLRERVETASRARGEELELDSVQTLDEELAENDSVEERQEQTHSFHDIIAAKPGGVSSSDILTTEDSYQPETSNDPPSFASSKSANSQESTHPKSLIRGKASNPQGRKWSVDPDDQKPVRADISHVLAMFGYGEKIPQPIKDQLSVYDQKTEANQSVASETVANQSSQESANESNRSAGTQTHLGSAFSPPPEASLLERSSTGFDDSPARITKQRGRKRYALPHNKMSSSSRAYVANEDEADSTKKREVPVQQSGSFLKGAPPKITDFDASGGTFSNDFSGEDSKLVAFRTPFGVRPRSDVTGDSDSVTSILLDIANDNHERDSYSESVRRQSPSPNPNEALTWEEEEAELTYENSLDIDLQRRLPEYKTHAELIGTTNRPEVASDALEGYGTVKPSSIYDPEHDSSVEGTLGQGASDQANENSPRSVSPIDETKITVTEKSDLGTSRHDVEYWRPEDQRPRIKIHLPFVQEETVIQLQPEDWHSYGPPKAVYKESDRNTRHHGSSNIAVSGRDDVSQDGPPAQAYGAGSAAVSGIPEHIPQLGSVDQHQRGRDSEVPSSLLPKEHREPLVIHQQSEAVYHPPLGHKQNAHPRPHIEIPPVSEYHPPEPGYQEVNVGYATQSDRPPTHGQNQTPHLTRPADQYSPSYKQPQPVSSYQPPPSQTVYASGGQPHQEPGHVTSVEEHPSPQQVYHPSNGPEVAPLHPPQNIVHNTQPPPVRNYVATTGSLKSSAPEFHSPTKNHNAGIYHPPEPQHVPPPQEIRNYEVPPVRNYQAHPLERPTVSVTAQNNKPSQDYRGPYSAGGQHQGSKTGSGSSIVGVLKREGSVLLLTLLKLTGLDTLLADTGPYTLFAPTEAALQELLDRLGGVDALLQQMGKQNVVKLLQYHVIRGFALSEDLENDLLGKTLEGGRVRVNLYDTYSNSHGRALVTTVNGEQLVRPDLLAENGVVHFISGVLAPPPADVVSALRKDPLGRFSVLVEALQLAGISPLLEDYNAGPFTLFAPTNRAFTLLDATELRDLLRDRHRLRDLLLGHAVSGTLYSAGLQPFQEVTTLAGTTASVFKNGGSVKVDSSLVVVADVTAANGVVHAIDAVLQPAATYH